MPRPLTTVNGPSRPGPNGTPRRMARRIALSADMCRQTLRFRSGSSSSRTHSSTEAGTGILVQDHISALRRASGVRSVSGSGSPIRPRIRAASPLSIRPSRKPTAAPDVLLSCMAA